MNKDFAAFMKAQKSSSVKKLQDEARKLNQTFERETDNGEYWKPTVDKAGNASVHLRWLPCIPSESAPFIRYWDHKFKGPGGWFFGKSRTTLGKDEADPVSEMNRQLWEQGEDSPGRARVTGTKDNPGTKRKLHYVSNVYIINDSGNPANNGKVFKYIYGKKIFEKLEGKMFPKFEDQQAIDPFNLFTGCSFRLRQTVVEGWPNFDSSEFDPPGPLTEDPELLERIFKSLYPLQPLIAPDKFMTYEEMAAKLARVLGTSASAKAASKAPTKAVEARQEPSAPPPALASSGDDEEDEEWFRSLAEEDSDAPF